MSVPIVTPAEFIIHARLEADEDETFIAAKISAAQAFIEARLGFSLDVYSEESPSGEIPSDLKEAVLMMAAHFWENREASLVAVSGQRLPFGVEDILFDHTDHGFGG